VSNIIGVKILSATDKTLQTVDGDGQNVVHRHQDGQPITWQLVDDAAGGEFTSLATDPPPIEWIPPLAPANTFKDHKLTHGKKTMKVDDTNDKASTAGSWMYRLSARINGDLYQTVLSKDSPIVAISDPVIINR
jgi:hypothetical protein